MPTLFTRIIDQEISSYKIYEDEYTYAFLDINPLQPGHTLIVPKIEVDKWYDLPSETVDQLMRTAQRLSPALEKTFDALRVVLVIEGFEVPHAHIHLVPMTQGVTLKDSKRETISSEELQKIHEKIENTMSE